MMTLDALAGLFLLGVMATLLAVASHARVRGADSLAQQRTALSAAQQALAALRDGDDLVKSNDVTVVSIQRTGRMLGGQEWVQVTATCQRRSATLVGLAPRRGGAQ